MKRITWNRRYNMYVDKMKTGDIFEVADVVRTLAVQETEKKLSAGERRLLTTAKQILLSEFMLVESVDEEKSENGWISLCDFLAWKFACKFHHEAIDH